jgi:phage shock protein E
MSTINSGSSIISAIIFSVASLFGLGSDTPTVTAQQVLASPLQYQVLDVRTAEEFAEGHIEGAINIPHDSIADEIAKLKAIDGTIVVHCRSGYRAGKAESVMKKNGLTNFVHLEGDMLGWQEQNLPLVTKQK